MGGHEVYVGVDVSKERLDVALRPSGECFGEANDEQAVSRLVKRLKPCGVHGWWWKPPAATKQCWSPLFGLRDCRW